MSKAMEREKAIPASGEDNVTRGSGLLEGFLAKQRAKTANKMIPEILRKGRILDIGCGTQPLFLLGTDFSEKHGLEKVGSAEKYSTADVNIKNFDLEKEDKLPFNRDYFDVVTMLAVFEHIEPARLPLIISEIKRILKPDGRFIMTTPAVWTDKILRLMAKIGLVSSEEIEEHKDAYTPKKISFFLEQAGFIKQNIDISYFEALMNIKVSATRC